MDEREKMGQSRDVNLVFRLTCKVDFFVLLCTYIIALQAEESDVPVDENVSCPAKYMQNV